MLCKISDLIVDVPAAGDLVPRCEDYLYNGELGADIIIRTELFEPEYWPNISETKMIYMESGIQFYDELPYFDGIMLHASAVMFEGKAYLFFAPCGTGKSTHARLWQQLLGDSVQVINDDKPALRRIKGKWYAYGTPWCGKDGINLNCCAPIAGLCSLKQASENRIRRLNAAESIQKIISQTTYMCRTKKKLNLILSLLDSLLREIPIFELENRPEIEAARLSYETMKHAAEEMEL